MNRWWNTFAFQHFVECLTIAIAGLVLIAVVMAQIYTIGKALEGKPIPKQEKSHEPRP